MLKGFFCLVTINNIILIQAGILTPDQDKSKFLIPQVLCIFDQLLGAVLKNVKKTEKNQFFATI